MKLLIVAVLSVVLTTAIIIYSDKPSTPVEPPAVTNPIKVSTKIIFSPSDVRQVTWKYGSDQMVFKPDNGQSKAVQWALQRRLVILSKLATLPMTSLTDAKGAVTLKTLTEEFQGIYNDKSFQWTSGPLAGQGVEFSNDSNLREVFAEGLWGFKTHVIDFCDSKKITKVILPDWSLEKNKGIWFLHISDKIDRARPEALKIFFEKLCHVVVDTFDIFDGPQTTTAGIQIESATKILEVKKSGALFIAKDFPSFKSQSLDELLTPTAQQDIRDPSSEEGKVATDRSQSQEDRIKNIRKLRGNNSPEALGALRAIIFENTDIDLFRYEAVDTLAATGTKEAFKIIRERLSQVSRSGFELRLARALAGAMGRFFKSDEKTPEDVRRPEVDELLKAAEEHPPGKALANQKSQ